MKGRFDPPPPPKREESDLVYGLRAGLGVYARRREHIQRVAFVREVRKDVAELARWAGSRGVLCEELPARELDRIVGSSHHEGLVVATRARRWTTPKELAEVLTSRAGRAIALDRVRNPQNIGAILRSAAFFGLDGALLGAPAPDPALSPVAVRVAEGGAEHLLLTRTTDLADTLARLRARGIHVVGADAHAETPVAHFEFQRPLILVVGHEREGLGERVRAQCDARVAVRGTGAVESLNVAVATGILLAAMTR